MKPVVTYPDVERETRDLVAFLLAPFEPGVTVGVGVPAGWTLESGDHVQIACDGTPSQDHPVAVHPTMRVVVWSGSTTRAKALANLVHGLITAHGGAGAISAVLPMTGLLPARDSETGAELASFTVRVTVRSMAVT